MINWLTGVTHNGGQTSRGDRPSSVLVLVRGAPSDMDLVRLACEILESRRGRLHILYVIEVARDTPVDAEIAAHSSIGERVLEDMERVARRYSRGIETQLVQARYSGSAVVREAVDMDVEAIVIGTSIAELHGSFSLERHVPYILRHAPCRVVVSRDPIQAPPGLPAHTLNSRVW